MSNTGLSKPRLKRMRRVLSGYVERGEVPGLVAVVARDDDVFVEALGALALDDAPPMRSDTIVRIASLAKPITAVAAMILVEECKLRLDASIDPWIPELANRRVLRSLDSEIDDTVPAERAITLRDLLTFRLGFGSVMAPPGTYPIQRLVHEYAIGGDGPPVPTRAPATDEWIRRLGSLPLIAQPGRTWMYHVGADVLGLLISRVSGQSLGRFLHERLFAPLEMRDTGFCVPAEKLDRLATSYTVNAATGALDVFDDRANSAWHPEPPFESGGGGLVGTAVDYLAFCRMMLNRGRCGRKQVLSRASVELMTRDQLTPDQRAGAEIFFGDYRSWGFGMSVDVKRDDLFHVPGRFGWDGGLGTTAYTDPSERTISILFTQRAMTSPTPPQLFTDFWTLAYAAIA